MVFTVATFVAFTVLVAVISWWKTRDDDLSTKEGYFLAEIGRASCRERVSASV